jgi:hypothetical protein
VQLRQPGAAAEEADRAGAHHPVLARPCELERLAADDHVAGLVAERAQLARVGVRRAEAPRHERCQLLGVRGLLEPRPLGVVRRDERRVVGVDDEDAHGGRA